MEAAMQGRSERIDLTDIVAQVRSFPGLTGKAAIAMVSDVLGPSDWISGPGDDGAVTLVDVDGGSLAISIVSCGEAIHPQFVRQDPYGAGIAAVLANVNDLAAMGARPLCIVDTVIATADVARRILKGMRDACRMYDVPLVGGHLTDHPGEPALSAFAVGQATRPLSVSRAAPGQSLMVAACLDGEMRVDFPFFRAFESRGSRMAADIRILPELAASGDVVAAKDVSMAGLLGTLGMLLEQHKLGVEVDLSLVPTPVAVDLGRWLTCFPSYGFLLCVPSGREAAVTERFSRDGLAAAVVGCLDGSGVLSVRHGDETATVLDFATDSVTGLR
jgi:selenophosphate synthetase-related protein